MEQEAVRIDNFSSENKEVTIRFENKKSITFRLPSGSEVIFFKDSGIELVQLDGIAVHLTKEERK